MIVLSGLVVTLLVALILTVRELFAACAKRDKDQKQYYQDLMEARTSSYDAGRRDMEATIVRRTAHVKWRMFTNKDRNSFLEIALSMNAGRNYWYVLIPVEQIKEKVEELLDKLVDAQPLPEKDVDTCCESCHNDGDFIEVDLTEELERLRDAADVPAHVIQRRPRRNMSNTSTSATQRLLNYLQSGRDITVRQAQTRFGIDNVSGRISELRQRGYSIYLNEKTNPWTGRKFRAYRLGTPTRRIVRLGNIAKNDYFYAGF